MRKWQIRKFLNLFVLICTLMSCACHSEKQNKRSTRRWPLHLNYISTHFIFISKIPISSLNSFIKSTSLQSSPFSFSSSPSVSQSFWLLQVKGIPQGSILSPLLCNLYYGEAEKQVRIIIFAIQNRFFCVSKLWYLFLHIDFFIFFESQYYLSDCHFFNIFLSSGFRVRQRGVRVFFQICALFLKLI